ncbi:hypothetical protein RRG08_022613 [Elysia crispata]|uniref:Uncharacterized protein n=1 Tax=Elysia crispata TaxID=231223 RepID=A0AAE0Z1K3_9GAST|nr:hypothetical protein RRG08_022613 [Elysia crispata]
MSLRYSGLTTAEYYNVPTVLWSDHRRSANTSTIYEVHASELQKSAIELLITYALSEYQTAERTESVASPPDLDTVVKTSKHKVSWKFVLVDEVWEPPSIGQLDSESKRATELSVSRSPSLFRSSPSAHPGGLRLLQLGRRNASGPMTDDAPVFQALVVKQQVTLSRTSPRSMVCDGLGLPGGAVWVQEVSKPCYFIKQVVDRKKSKFLKGKGMVLTFNRSFITIKGQSFVSRRWWDSQKALPRREAQGSLPREKFEEAALMLVLSV